MALFGRKNKLSKINTFGWGGDRVVGLAPERAREIVLLGWLEWLLVGGLERLGEGWWVHGLGLAHTVHWLAGVCHYYCCAIISGCVEHSRVLLYSLGCFFLLPPYYQPYNHHQQHNTPNNTSSQRPSIDTCFLHRCR